MKILFKLQAAVVYAPAEHKEIAPFANRSGVCLVGSSDVFLSKVKRICGSVEGRPNMAIAKYSFTANGWIGPVVEGRNRFDWKITKTRNPICFLVLPQLALRLVVMVAVCGAGIAQAASCIPGSQAVPAGSYLQTCSGASVSGTTLRADCKEVTGSVHTGSELRDCQNCLPQSDIANSSGELHCSKGNMPFSGSYMQTCRFIYVIGTTLIADCKEDSGRWHGAVQLPNMLSCLNGSIINVSGVLQCSSAPPPGGSYKQSCDDIWYFDGVLHARCRTTSGNRNSTQSKASPGSACSNQNGNLQCQ
jgi:hypothetical protein